jgi:hypothetical protein
MFKVANGSVYILLADLLMAKVELARETRRNYRRGELKEAAE